MKLIAVFLSFLMCISASLTQTAEQTFAVVELDEKQAYEIDSKAAWADFYAQQEARENKPVKQSCEDHCLHLSMNVGIAMVSMFVLVHCYALLSALKLV